MNDKDTLNENNFEEFAGAAIKKYNDCGRILDAMLWRSIIVHYKKARQVEREKLEAELEKWKQGYNERVSESTERLLRIQKLEAEIAELNARWEKLEEGLDTAKEIGFTRIQIKWIRNLMQQLSSGGEVR
jgi:chromosome segregation ATPase